MTEAVDIFKQCEQELTRFIRCGTIFATLIPATYVVLLMVVG
jgi:hypothetical protein